MLKITKIDFTTTAEKFYSHVSITYAVVTHYPSFLIQLDGFQLIFEFTIFSLLLISSTNSTD